MAVWDKGFTLVELAVTVSIAAVLATVALPGLNALLDRQRTSSALSSLVTHLQSARLAAVAHRRPVVLCPTPDGVQCTEGSDWSTGWLMYIDHEGTLDDHILRMDLTPRSRELLINASAGRTRVRYLPDGRSAGTNLTIHVCDRSGHRLGAVVVNNAGRPRIERDPARTPCPA